MERNKISSIMKSIVVVVSFLMASKLLSFFIDIMTANSLGASSETDVYFVIYSVYTIISPMISIGIWKVYMPAYKERLVLNREKEAIEITNRLLIFLLIFSIAIVLLINAFPIVVISIFAPGFCREAVDFGVPLLRMISILFITGIVHTFGSAILQSNNLFRKSQSKSIIVHIPTFTYLICFCDRVTVWGLTISILIGEILSAVIMVKFSKLFTTFKIPSKIFNKEIWRIVRIMPSACAVSVIDQMNAVIDKAFASLLLIGSITCLNYGSRLCNFFVGIFSTAVSTALFPSLTELLVKNEKKRIDGFVEKYFSILAFFIIAATVYLAIFAKDLVMVLLGHGLFDSNVVHITGDILIAYSLGLLAACFNTIINDVLYIKKLTSILLWTTITNLLLNVIFNCIFITKFDVVGLSLATSVSLYITLILKLYLIRKYFTVKNLSINIITLVLIGLFCYGTEYILPINAVDNVYLRLLIGAAILGALYSTLACFFNRFYRRMLSECRYTIKKNLG